MDQQVSFIVHGANRFIIQATNNMTMFQKGRSATYNTSSFRQEHVALVYSSSKSAFGAKVATRDTSQKKKIVPDVAICGSVTVRERFRKKKKSVATCDSPTKKKTGLDLFLFSLSHSRVT